MNTVRLDAGFPDNPKVDDLSDGAFRMHVRALCYCAQQLTDGIVSDSRARKLGSARHLTELVESGLWSKRADGAFGVGGYLEQNPTRAQVESKRVATRERMRRLRGGEVWDPDDDPADDGDAVGDGVTTERTERVTNASTASVTSGVTNTASPHTPLLSLGSGSGSSSDPDLPFTLQPKDLKESAREQEARQILEVFEFWQAETGHSKAILDERRKSRIRARLRQGFTVERLKAAIRNRRNKPFLMGENDTGTVYDDLHTLLRDAAQVEKLERLTTPERRPGRRNGPLQADHGATGWEALDPDKAAP
jgi:hypothetical protein